MVWKLIVNRRQYFRIPADSVISTSRLAGTNEDERMPGRLKVLDGSITYSAAQFCGVKTCYCSSILKRRVEIPVYVSTQVKLIKPLFSYRRGQLGTSYCAIPKFPHTALPFFNHYVAPIVSPADYCSRSNAPRIPKKYNHAHHTSHYASR